MSVCARRTRRKYSDRSCAANVEVARDRRADEKIVGQGAGALGGYCRGVFCRCTSNKMTYQTLIVSLENRIATITLSRPEKRNAVSFQLVEDLIGALRETEKS